MKDLGIALERIIRELVASSEYSTVGITRKIALETSESHDAKEVV